MQYALVDNITGLVENVIILAPASRWAIPEGKQLIRSDSAQIGQAWDGETFINVEG